MLRAQFSNLFFYSSFSLSFPFVASKYRRIQLSTTVHLILASLLRLEDVPFISQIFLFFLLNPRNTRHSISQNPPNSRFQFFSLLLILYLDSCYSLLPVPASSVQSRDKLAPSLLFFSLLLAGNGVLSPPLLRSRYNLHFR